MATPARTRTAAGPRSTDEHAPVVAVTDPATGRTVGEVPRMDREEVAALVARARAAQPAWAALGVGGRVAVVDAFRRRLAAHADLVVETLQAETGKPWEDCSADVLLVVAWAAQWCAGRAERWLADEEVGGGNLFAIGRRSVVTREPLGVVGVIGPWNVPLALTIGDALPALLAGNTVVCKPSELTPLGVDLAARLWLEAGGPPDVLLVATGDGSTGAALVDEVDAIHFTGSVATGRAVAARAGDRLVPCTLELGGKDAMLVLADADLDRAAAACVHYALFNTGQVCMSVERVYVEEAVHDRFVELVLGRVRRLHQGVPQGPGTADLSALISAAQLDVVREHVADAVDRGARVAHGGRATSGPGTFHEPTVLVDVDHSMRCMTEETFGPTIPIMRVADADEAVALANDCDLGLTASVWTRDVARGEALARRLEAGTVTVNDAMFHLGDVALPMGGWKQSGLGVRNGAEGIRAYTRPRVVQTARTFGDADPSWMPYAPRRSRVLSRVYGTALALPDPGRLPRPTALPGAAVRTAGRLLRGTLGVARTVARR